MFDRDEMLAQVARDYYQDHLTQDEIGRRINASRSTVSRLLQQAVDRGIVRIIIDYPWERAHDLEARLVERFRLREAHVLLSKGRDEAIVRDGMGVLAARIIDREIADRAVLGISYGRSLASTIAALSPSRPAAVTVVPIIGALGSENPSIDGPELVRRLAQTYGGDFRYLPVPLLVDDVRTRDALSQTMPIFETLALARRADIILMGIGALTPGHSSMIWAGYLSEAELAWLRDQGAVGHMVAQFYDINGRMLEVEANQRSVGIGIRSLVGKQLVIAVAGGEPKGEAILGALRGHYLNVLVTDDAAARRVLALADAAEGGG
ncbi:MAG TPA: sugar-binding transcriptional regulator [Anaerolineae bacterium]